MKNYIPKHTSDMAAIEHLRSLPFENVKAYVPELLEWMQDMHWDVSQGIAEYLLPHVDKIKEELLFILNANDGMWEWNIIRFFLADPSYKLYPDFITILKRIAEHPTNMEKEDEVDELAREVLAQNQYLNNSLLP